MKHKYKYPCTNISFGEHVYTFLMGSYLQMGLLSHKVYICSHTANQCFLKWTLQLTFPPALYESSCCFSIASKLEIINLLHFNHYGGYVLLFPCGYHCCFYINSTEI